MVSAGAGRTASGCLSGVACDLTQLAGRPPCTSCASLTGVAGLGAKVKAVCGAGVVDLQDDAATATARTTGTAPAAVSTITTASGAAGIGPVASRAALSACATLAARTPL